MLKETILSSSAISISKWQHQARDKLPLSLLGFFVWNPIHLVYGGTYQYVLVCIALYRLVLLWCTYRYVPLVIVRMAVLLAAAGRLCSAVALELVAG